MKRKTFIKALLGSLGSLLGIGSAKGYRGKPEPIMADLANAPDQCYAFWIEHGSAGEPVSAEWRPVFDDKGEIIEYSES